MDQKAVKVDGHYELPLPLKDENIRLANNRVAAMKRCRVFEKEVQRIFFQIFQRIQEFYGRIDGERICKKNVAAKDQRT